MSYEPVFPRRLITMITTVATNTSRAAIATMITATHVSSIEDELLAGSPTVDIVCKTSVTGIDFIDGIDPRASVDEVDVARTDAFSGVVLVSRADELANDAGFV